MRLWTNVIKHDNVFCIIFRSVVVPGDVGILYIYASNFFCMEERLSTLYWNCIFAYLGRPKIETVVFAYCHLISAAWLQGVMMIMKLTLTRFCNKYWQRLTFWVTFSLLISPPTWKFEMGQLSHTIIPRLISQCKPLKYNI